MDVGRPREEASAGAAGAMALLPSGARWMPSHVQVTVQRARALRPKGGPDGAFVALELGRQRLRTAVAPQRDGGPRWGEDCALELPPSDRPDDEALLLRVTVWQRALVGPDRFLGRASVPLNALLDGGRAHHDQWYQLHSKPGKKEKERGEVQLSIQFTRHSLTASMFDLSIKDKPRSPFGRLKDKVKGRKYDLESASAIVPSSSGGLEDSDFDLVGKKAKARGVGGFFKSRLRRSSLTQSNTSLGSDSTISSSGSLAGLGALEMTASSPRRQSILSTDHPVGDVLSSPKLTHKRASSDEAPQALPESKSVPSNEPTSRSSLCINGSHVYCEEPSSKPAPQSPALPPAPPQSKSRESPVSAAPHVLEPELPPWSSSHFQKGPPKDPPRFIPSPPILAAQEEDKLSVKTIALNKHRGRVRREEGLRADSRPVQIATPIVFSSEVMRVRPRTEKEEAAPKTGVFRRGSGTDSDRQRLVGEGLSGPTKDVVTAGRDEGDQSGQWNLRDAKESLPMPSSPPEWLDAPEVAKDTRFSADRGPTAFTRVGELQVGVAARGGNHREVQPPLDWDDSFDAFATSRLRPEVWRDSPHPPGPILDSAASAGGGDGADPREGQGEPQGSAGCQEGEEPSPAHSKRRLVQHFGEQQEGWPEEAVLAQGAVLAPGACEEPSRTGDSAGAKGARESQHHGEQLAREGEVASIGGPVLPSGAPSDTLLDSELPWDWAVEDAASRPTFLEVVFPEGEEENTLKARAWEEPALELPQEDPSVKVEAESSSSPDLQNWDLGSPGRSAGLMSVCPEHRGIPPEPGCSMEGGEEQAGGVAEPPPPKPPRRFTPLSLEEEAGRVVGDMQVECQPQEDPAGGTCLQVIMSGEDAGSGKKGFRVCAEAERSLQRVHERTSSAVSSGDTLLVANGGAEQPASWLPKLSGGGNPEQVSHQESGEPGSLPWGALRLAEFPGRVPAQTAQELSGPGEAGARPSRALQESAASPSRLFCSALQEQMWLPPGCADWESGLGTSKSRQDQGERLGLNPRLEPVGRSTNQTLPPDLPSAKGTLRERTGGSFSSSWSEDGVTDFKLATFWQTPRGGQSSTCDPFMTPGNPFASLPGPPAKNNPFLEEHPAVLPPPLELPDLFPASNSEVLSRLHDPQPVAASTPSVGAAPHPGGFELPSPIVSSGGSARPSLSGTASAPSVLPAETQPAEESLPQQMTSSPHVVRPISTPVPETAGVEEASKHLQQPGLNTSQSPDLTGQPRPPSSSVESTAPVLQLHNTEPKRDSPGLDPSAKYYHLTHEELIQLVLKREAELGKKQEHVQELEGYIDRLLVRIMEQSPTLLQIPLRREPKIAK